MQQVVADQWRRPVGSSGGPRRVEQARATHRLSTHPHPPAASTTTGKAAENRASAKKAATAIPTSAGWVNARDGDPVHGADDDRDHRRGQPGEQRR